MTPLDAKKEEINDMDIKNRNKELTQNSSKVYEEDAKDENALLKKENKYYFLYYLNLHELNYNIKLFDNLILFGI